jgi:hypothetical protein
MTATTELTDLDRRIGDLRRFEQDYRQRLRLFHQQQLNDLDPESGTVTIPRLPADQRKHLIEWLGAQFIEERAWDWPAGTAPHLLALWGNGSLRGIAVDRAFADYVDAARLCRDIDGGLVSWQDIFPDLKSSDPQDEARKIARGRAERALAVLVYGDPSLADADPRPAGGDPSLASEIPASRQPSGPFS